MHAAGRSPAAANTITRTRAVFHGAPGYAVEPGLLAANPANRMQWRAPTAAVSVNPSTIASPAHGRGKMILTAACPRTGTAWTSTGRPHEARGLKHRPSTIRVVPMPPVLVAMLLQHFRESGTAPDRRLFCGARAGMLSESVYRHRHHSSVTTRESERLYAPSAPPQNPVRYLYATGPACSMPNYWMRGRSLRSQSRGRGSHVALSGPQTYPYGICG